MNAVQMLTATTYLEAITASARMDSREMEYTAKVYTNMYVHVLLCYLNLCVCLLVVKHNSQKAMCEISKSVYGTIPRIQEL